MAARRNSIRNNLAQVRERMAAAAARSGRDPRSVELVVVTKSASDAAVRQAIDLGEMDLAESRAQELADRAAMAAQHLASKTAGPPPAMVRWHMVGHLQRNKVRPLMPLVHMIHSVDTLRLAETIDQSAARAGAVLPVLMEVNCSGEPQKYGVAVGAAECLAEQIATLRHVELRGVMTMAPQCDDPEKARGTFARMREVFEDIVRTRRAGAAFRDLSMGMSQDFEVAIEEGATIVRVGSAIFG